MILAVHKTPMSGTGEELRDFTGISAAAIIKTVERLATREHTGAGVAGRERRR